MDIQQLHYFVVVCDCGSISKAAETLHLSQQGVSAAIRRLETELSCDLFYRKAGGIVITEAGLTVKREAEKILRHVDNIYDGCRGQKAGRTRIDLAITESLILRLPKSLQQFLITGDGAFDVRMHEGYSWPCLHMVEEGECSFGIVYGDADPKLFDSTPLDVVKQVIIVNREHPLADREEICVSDLSGLPFVITRPGSVPRTLVEKMFAAAGAELKVAYECDRPAQTVEIIANTPNLAGRALADAISERDMKNLRILRLKDDPFLLPIQLITRRGHQLSGNERAFRRIVMASFEA